MPDLSNVAGAFSLATEAVGPIDAAAADGSTRSDRLTKPPGSLGRLEVLGAQLCGLGEGSGACLAAPLVSSAARILREMATFDSAGITGKEA